MDLADMTISMKELDLIAAGRPIPAVQSMRSRLDLDLRTAKNLLDEIRKVAGNIPGGSWVACPRCNGLGRIRNPGR